MSNADQTANRNFEHHQDGKERIDAVDASTNAFPGGFQAIAAAYGDYTKKSFEDSRSSSNRRPPASRRWPLTR